MDLMKISKKVLDKYLAHTATIYVQSTPQFLMEAFILLVAFALTLFQHVNIINYSKKILRLKPHTIYCNNDGDENESTTSVRRRNNVTTVAYKRPSEHSSKSQLGWILSGRSDAQSTEEDKKRLADELITLTPKQFVKLEKERRMREKDLDTSQYSLSTLCQIAIKKQWSDATFKDKLAALKENLECNSSSFEGIYLGNKTGMMTESLLCMLENLITKSSVDNPLPFKGNIATFALDAAELVKDNKIGEKKISQSKVTEKATVGRESPLKNVNWADVVPQSEELD